MLQELKAEGITQALERLEQRMGHFSHEGLKGLCTALIKTSRTSAKQTRGLSRPYLGLRSLVLCLILGAIAVQLWLVASLQWSKVDIGRDAVEVSQGLDSLVNLVILTGGTAWFLLGIESKVKRARALKALNALRGFAHVVDMYQLAKDPSVLPGTEEETGTLGPVELTRYLEYCAELLALVGKLAALFGEHTNDPDLIAAVADVEMLTNQLSLKIWQKIAVVHGPLPDLEPYS